MKAKKVWLLLLGCGLGIAAMLVNRYVVTMPEWLTICSYVIAITALLFFMSENKK